MKNKLILSILVISSAVYMYADTGTFYEEVGIDRSSTAEQIRSQCRKEMFKYHPDKNPGDASAEAKFKEINNACEVLKDPAKRSAYNESLEKGKPTSGDNRGSTLTIEGPASQEKEDTSPEGWLNKIKAKVQSKAKGKEEKISNLVGNTLAKIPIPNQSKTLFNQDLAIKDMSFVKAPVSGDVKAGVGFTGTMKFNQFSIKGTVYAFIDKKNGKQVSVEAELPDQYKLSDMFPTVIKPDSVINKLKMPKGKMIVSSVAYKASNGWSVKPGFTFNAELDLSGPVEIIHKLQEEAIKMPGVIAEGGQAMIGATFPLDITKLELKATIPLKIGVDFSKMAKVPQSIKNVFKQIYTEEFSVAAKPAKTELDAEGSMKLILGTQPDPLTFVILGAVRAKAPQISIGGRMDGMVELKWAALGDLAAQIDIDQAILPATAAVGIPFTGIGLTGKLDLGKKGATRAELEAAAKISLKSSDIPDLFFELKGSNLALSDFIIFMSKVAAKQGVAAKPISEDKMPKIKINTLAGKLATADIELAGKKYKKGLSIDANVELFSQQCELGFFLDPDPKNLHVGGKGYLSPIDLKVISLTGDGCASDSAKRAGACVEFDFQAAKPQEGTFAANGKLGIPKLNLNAQVALTLEKNKFKALFDSMLKDEVGTDLFGVGFNVGIEPTKLDEFEAGFKFKGDFAGFLNANILPEIRKFKANAVREMEIAEANWRKANADWNKFNDQVRDATRELNKHRAEVTAAQGKVGQAKSLLNRFLDPLVKSKWEKVQSDKRYCERLSREWKEADRKAQQYKGVKWFSKEAEAARGNARNKWLAQIQCAKIIGTGTDWLATKGVSKITQGEFDAAKGVMEGYKQATKAADGAKQAFETASRGLNKASGEIEKAKILSKGTKAVVGAFEKLVEVVAAGANIINLKQAEGSTSGKDLKAGKLPKLVVLEIGLQIPPQIPEIGGKGKTITLRNLQFDFKNPKSSIQSIAKSLANTIKEMVKP